jgi:cytochrome c-type biogenesis protein CcmH/NrfG
VIALSVALVAASGLAYAAFLHWLAVRYPQLPNVSPGEVSDALARLKKLEDRMAGAELALGSRRR